MTENTRSYRTRCEECDRDIAMSARFCPKCGTQQWGDSPHD